MHYAIFHSITVVPGHKGSNQQRPFLTSEEEDIEIAAVEKMLRQSPLLHRRLGCPDYHGREAALLRLWREKRGEAEPDGLSSNLVVQLGAATEEPNRTWYERNTGRHGTDVQRRVRHSAIPWMVATLDGTVEATGAVFESKFMLPWSFSEEAAAEKYM